jgi:hypothetical protein
MRAGEPEAAAEILDQVEGDLKAEQASLYEAARDASRPKAPVGSRVATALLGLAVAGTSILGVSAAGMAVAGAFKQHHDAKLGTNQPPSTRMVAAPASGGRSQPDRSGAKGSVQNRSRAKGSVQKRPAVKHVKVAGVSFKLSARQQQRFDRYTSADPVDRAGLSSLLRQVLPASAFRRVNDALASAPQVGQTAPDPASLPQTISSTLPAVVGNDSGTTSTLSPNGKNTSSGNGKNTSSGDGKNTTSRHGKKTGSSGGGAGVLNPAPSPTVDHVKVNLAPTPKL